MMSLFNVIKSVETKNSERPIEHQTIKIEKRPPVEVPPELQQIARNIIADAESQAGAIRQQLADEQLAFKQHVEQERQVFELEKAEVLEAVKQQGYQQGFDEGKSEAHKTYQDKLTLAHDVLASSEAEYHRYLEQAEAEILELAIHVSRKIIGMELKDTPQKWTTLVKEAIREVREQDPIKVMVHPKWFEHVIEHREEIEAITHHHRVMFIPDDQITENDCIVETPFGRIEAGIDQQLSMIRSRLFEMLEAHKHESLSTPR